MCLLYWIVGVSLIIGGVVLEIAWLGICFGSVVIGILLLIFAPGVLLAPFLFGSSVGTAVIQQCNK